MDFTAAEFFFNSALIDSVLFIVYFCFNVTSSNKFTKSVVLPVYVLLNSPHLQSLIHSYFLTRRSAFQVAAGATSLQSHYTAVNFHNMQFTIYLYLA